MQEEKEKTAYIELTRACPCSCSHCYIPVELRRATPVCSLADFTMLKNLSVTGVVLSGGEPTIYPYLPEAVYHAKRFFNNISVISNGVKVDVLQQIASLATIWISLDYYGKKHDKWRGYSGLWQNYRQLANVVNVRSTLMKDNLKDIEKLIELVVAYNQQITIVPYKGENTHLTPTPLIMTQLLGYTFDNNYDANVVIDDPSVRAWISVKTGLSDFIGCSACDGTFRVTPEGNITPCPFLPQVICSLHDTLPHIKAELAKTRDKLLNTYTGKCQNCTYKSICGGCKASPNIHCIL